MYILLRKTEAGLKEFSENQNIGANKLEMGYVSGLGFGAMSGAFALVNVLADSVSIIHTKLRLLVSCNRLSA